jgi:uncharacterized delta-60 repeat protein
MQFAPLKIAALSDGSFIVGGTYGPVGSSTKRGAFRHYSATGVLDTSFGTNGMLQLTALSTKITFIKLSLLPSGELQAIVNDNLQQGYVVRFSSTGVLDSSYGNGGLATIDLSPTYGEEIFDGVTDSSSRVLGLGYIHGTNASNATEFLFRLNANGALDTTYGTNGFVQGFQFTNSYVTGSPQLVLAGNGYSYLGTSLVDQSTPIPYKPYLFRFDINSGAQDTSFGGSGSVMTSYKASAQQTVNSAAILGDGSVVYVGGQSGAIQSPLLVGKLTTGGQPAAFGANSDGTAEVSFGTSGAMGYDVIAQSDGKILVGGTVNSIPGTVLLTDYGLARLNADGTLDQSFGTGGTLITKFDGYTADTLSKLAIDSSGNIYAAGTAGMGTSTKDALLRYSSTGQLDTSFGTGGRMTTSINPSDTIYAIIPLANGQLLVAGRSYSTTLGYYVGFITRLNHDGSTDTTFGSNGVATVIVNSSTTSVDQMTVDAVGRIYTASYISSSQIQLRRYTAAGQLDSSFGTSGIANYSTLSSIGSITDLQLSGSGKLLVYGKTSGSPTDVYVMAFYTDGSAVSTFGTSGKQIYDFSGVDTAARLLVRPNGKWVLTGAGTGTTTQADYAAVQVAGEPLDTTPPTMSAARISSPRPAVQVTFSEKVTVPTAANLSLISKTTGQAFAVPQSWVSYNTTTLQLTVSPDSTLPNDNYQLQIAGGSELDFAANTQPTTFNGDFFFLTADANGDRTVNALDFNALATNYGKAGTFSQGDFDFSGTVNSADFAILAARYGKVLAAPSNALLPMAASPAAANLFANKSVDDSLLWSDVLV